MIFNNYNDLYSFIYQKPIPDELIKFAALGFRLQSTDCCRGEKKKDLKEEYIRLKSELNRNKMKEFFKLEEFELI